MTELEKHMKFNVEKVTIFIGFQVPPCTSATPDRNVNHYKIEYLSIYRNQKSKFFDNFNDL